MSEMTLTQGSIGKVLTEEHVRDAIHIAVAPLIAAQKIYAGQHVGLTEDGDATWATKEPIGIVDPFLQEPVFPGQRCYVFLYPNTITSLRHEWTHPAFTGNASTQQDQVLVAFVDPAVAARARITEIGEALDLTFSQLMKAAETWVDEEDYTVQHDSESWRDDFPAYKDEFWALYEIVTGRRIPTGKRENFFSCSC